MRPSIGWGVLVGAGFALCAPPASAGRAWTFRDIIEVTRISSTAIASDAARAAFVTRRMSLNDNRTHYALFETATDRQGAPHLLATAAFLDDVQWNARLATWTVRADLGRGVQLCALAEGRLTALLERPAVPIGGAESYLPSPSEPSRSTGVLRYGWSPTGDAAWYVTIRPPSPKALADWWDKGQRYLPSRDSTTAFRLGPPAEAIELRIWTRSTGQDQAVAQVAGWRADAAGAFAPADIAWLDDHTLAFLGPSSDASDDRYVRQAFDRRTGALSLAATKAEPASSPSLPVPASARSANARPAARSDKDAQPSPPHMAALGGPFGAWRSADAKITVHGALYDDRLGLLSAPPAAWDTAAGSLSACSFDPAMRFAICSHEDQRTPPRLVRLSRERPALKVLAAPNHRYEAIAPLTVRRIAPRDGVHAGYLVLPRGYRRDHRYPTVVVTHASDARDQFAFLGLQWGFPVQVFAERGYVVALVNERAGDPSALAAYRGEDGGVAPVQVRRAMIDRAVTTLEATVADLVAQGLTDPERVAIAGYSRGGIVATQALSRSQVFRAGVNADTALFASSGYWRSEGLRDAYRALFGGSPTNASFQPAYRAYSPSWRAAQFSGPLLQLMTARVAPYSLELDAELREAGKPTELIVFPEETHLPHRPRTLHAAMEVSFDWIEFWLNGACRAAAAEACRRWADQAQARPATIRLRGTASIPPPRSPTSPPAE